MSKSFVAAFTVIALVAAAGVDFVNEAKMAAAAGRPIGAVEYLASIPGRVLGDRASLTAGMPLLAAPAPDAPIVVAEAPGAADPAPSVSPGVAIGVLAKLGGYLSGRRGGAAPDAAETDVAESPSEPPLRRIGGTNCTLVGTIKRCSIGN